MSSEQLLASNWIAVGAVAFPHLLYAFIWFFPQIWMHYFKKNSVEVFEAMAWMLKGVSRS